LSKLEETITKAHHHGGPSWDGGRRIRAEVVKRNGYWISIVRGSDGWPVLYDDIPAGSEAYFPKTAWEVMMRAALDDSRVVYRAEQAGHRLPECKHLTNY